MEWTTKNTWIGLKLERGIKMLHVYLAHPMAGLDNEEISYIREKMEEYVRSRHAGCDVEIVNSYHEEWADIPPVEALGMAFQMMAYSDIAYFGPEWEDSRGCVVEALVCKMYNIPYCTIPEGFCDE